MTTPLRNDGPKAEYVWDAEEIKKTINDSMDQSLDSVVPIIQKVAENSLEQGVLLAGATSKDLIKNQEYSNVIDPLIDASMPAIQENVSPLIEENMDHSMTTVKNSAHMSTNAIIDAADKSGWRCTIS